jgi:hypothetical protein
MITSSPSIPRRLTPPKPLILRPELNQGLLEVMGGGVRRTERPNSAYAVNPRPKVKAEKSANISAQELPGSSCDARTTNQAPATRRAT